MAKIFSKDRSKNNDDITNVLEKNVIAKKQRNLVLIRFANFATFRYFMMINLTLENQCNDQNKTKKTLMHSECS